MSIIEDYLELKRFDGGLQKRIMVEHGRSNSN